MQQAPASAPGTFPAQPPPATKPGFLHQLEVWWNDGFGDFNAKMKSAKEQIDNYNKQQDKATKETTAATQQALKDAAQATKDAATAVVKLPMTRVFEFHDRCQVAGNGAPDCQTTATNACRAKGFDERAAARCEHLAGMSGQGHAFGPASGRRRVQGRHRRPARRVPLTRSRARRVSTFPDHALSSAPMSLIPKVMWNTGFRKRSCSTKMRS